MKLNQFLVKAKINGYASKGEEGEEILEDGSKEFTYEENGFKYRDRYFGFNPFVGQEIVWENGEVLWAMNYYGRVVSEEIEAKEVYQFLKKALSQVKGSKPYRGPSRYQDGDYLYTNENQGNIDNFIGKEAISHRGKKVYELVYQGGIVKKY